MGSSAGVHRSQLGGAGARAREEGGGDQWHGPEVSRANERTCTSVFSFRKARGVSENSSHYCKFLLCSEGKPRSSEINFMPSALHWLLSGRVGERLKAKLSEVL